MSAITIGIIALTALVVMLVIRVPIGIALIAVSWGGLWVILDIDAAWGILKSVPFEFTASWTLTSVPMFVFMGYVCFHSGMTVALFDLAKALFSRIPGSLAISAIFASSGFAAVCGSSIACAAAMGRIAVPEMIRANYGRGFACATVAAGGTIGALIPPSILMIVYGAFAQVSVLELFVGGLFVGLATSVAYIMVILVVSLFRKDLVPRSIPQEHRPELWQEVRATFPVVLLIVGVFGGLFSGIFTATEAGAVGAALSLIIALGSRRLNRTMFRSAVIETATNCASLFIIAIGAVMMTRFLSISGVGGAVVGLVSSMELETWQLLAMIILIYLVLGMFLDPLGAMLLTLPVFLPILDAQNLNLIWFGVLMTKLLEIGMISPPFGLNVFVLKSVVGKAATLGQIYGSVLIFIGIDLILILLLAFSPGIFFLSRH